RYDGAWTAPPSSGLFEILGAHHFDIPPEARLLLAGSDRFMSSRAREADIEVPGLSGQLYPFQKAGVIYGVNAERTIIGDEMGLGKSCQAIATVQALRSYPALVVCPASLKLNWAKEYLSWLPGIG